MFKRYNIQELAKNAKIVEVKCPKCRIMTRVQPNKANGFLFKCLECNTNFSTEGE